jgi:hypothetical protein
MRTTLDIADDVLADGKMLSNEAIDRLRDRDGV